MELPGAKQVSSRLATRVTATLQSRLTTMCASNSAITSFRASWTVAASPAHIAEAVQRYSSMGYTWLKYHLSPFENVIDQIEAAQAVAPPVD